MKYCLLINTLLLSICCSIARADLAFTKEGLSPEAQDFADKRIVVYCLPVQMPYGKCQFTEKMEQLKAELLSGSNKGPRFLGHIDFLPSHFTRPKNIKEKYTTWVKQLLPASEWIKLTKYPDPHVRTSAFQALVTAYPDVDFLPIIKEHLTDNETIKRSAYDEYSMEKVGDVFMYIATSSSFNVAVKKFSREQQRTLFTALLTVPNELKSITDFLLYAESFPELYVPIRELAEEDTAALVSLAKYQKQQDIELIKQYLLTIDDVRVISALPHQQRYAAFEHEQRVMLAISHFPAPDLFNELKKRFISNLTAEFYQKPARPIHIRFNPVSTLYNAVARYRNEAALELLTTPYKGEFALTDDEVALHTKLVLNAISKNISPVYENLMWTLWTERDTVTKAIFDYLRVMDESRAFEVIKSNLSEVDKNSKSSPSIYSLDLLPSVLEFVRHHDESFYIETMIKFLGRPNISTFPVLIEQVKLTKHDAFQLLLLTLLNHKSPTIVEQTVDALLAYEDEGIEQIVVDSLKLNRPNRKNYGWNKRYQEWGRDPRFADLQTKRE